MQTNHITAKLGNMRKEQSFIVYPRTDDDEAILQSDGRICFVRLSDKTGLINRKNENYPNSVSLHPSMRPIVIAVPDEIVAQIEAIPVSGRQVLLVG